MEESELKEATISQQETSAPIITESTAAEIENEFETKERDSEEKVEAALFTDAMRLLYIG